MTKRENKAIVKRNRKKLFIEAWLRAETRGVTQAAFCQDYGLRRETFSRWVSQFKRPKPKILRRKLDPMIESKILEIDARYKGTWSASIIALALKGVVSSWTIRKVLKTRRKPLPAAPKKARAGSGFTRPNLIWSIDWTEFKLRGKTFYILLAIDESSRYWLSWEIFAARPTALDATRFINDIFSRYHALPLFMKSDQASIFMTSAWEGALAKRGVLPHRIEPRCPQQQGIIERGIRNVKAWLKACRPEELDELRQALDEGLSMLNFLKPKAIFDGRTPASLYFPHRHSAPSLDRSDSVPSEVRHAESVKSRAVPGVRLRRTDAKP